MSGCGRINVIYQMTSENNPLFDRNGDFLISCLHVLGFHDKFDDMSLNILIVFSLF